MVNKIKSIFTLRRGFLSGLFLALLNLILFITNVSADTWKTEFVDTSEKYFAYFYPRSIAVDASDHPHIAYGEKHLYYTYYDGSKWYYETVDSSSRVEHVALALDTAGIAHISYYDIDNEVLKYATNASGAWVTIKVDSSGDVGRFTSIALDTSGNAHISYYDDTSIDLKYATNASGTWMTMKVDSSGYVGEFTSIAIDTTDKAHISYRDYSYRSLKYASGLIAEIISTPAPSPTASATPMPTTTVSPTPTPVSSATPTPLPTPSTLCEAETITVSPSGTLKLKRGKSADVTIMVTGIDNCQVEGESITAAVNLAGRKRVSIVPASKTTDENGQVTFIITALKKTGNARITFQTGSVKKILTVRVR